MHMVTPTFARARRKVNPQICLALVVAVMVGGCTQSVPERQDDACALLKERKSWRKAVQRAQKKWDVPAGYQLAVIKFESNFNAKARTPRKRRLFGLLAGKRISSAYGYAQALDGTWDSYRRHSGNRSASRASFADATDFIGWYMKQTRERTQLSASNYKAHYIAYHEGAGGYLKGSWKGKTSLIAKSARLAEEARKFDKQIADCRFRRFLGIF